MEKTDIMKKMYQQSVKEKQDRLRTKSYHTKTQTTQLPKQTFNKTTGFLFKMFMRKNLNDNEQDEMTEKSEVQQFKFTFFDQFDNFPVNITGEGQSLDNFKKLIAEYKTHQLQQIKLVDIPRAGQRISMKFKQKIHVVLRHFFPYQIVYAERDYQLTLSNKIQHYSKKYKSFINLSNARTFLQDKNKKPSYVLLVPNMFQDLNEIHHEFDELIFGLIDGTFNNQMVSAQKIRCMTFAQQRVGMASINGWKSSKTFINIVSICIHQILHALQFDHCFKKKCLMNLRPNNAGLTMCSDCIQKFHTLFAVDLRKWFGQLSEVLRIIEQPQESQKLRCIYEALQDIDTDI